MFLTPSLSLFDKSLNQQWIEKKWANTPLGIYLGVDFRIQKVEYIVEHKYLKKIENGELSNNEVFELMKERLNVCKQINIEWLCVK